MARSDMNKMEILGVNTYNRPCECKECGGIMIFRGVGEYRCEDCGAIDFDDYGKTRGYIETHHGATAAQVAEETGVSQKAIRQMLKDSKLEVTSESRTFLKCESCGVSIRHGSYCSKCEANMHHNVEEQERVKRNQIGYSTEKQKADSGEKRFKRN